MYKQKGLKGKKGTLLSNYLYECLNSDKQYQHVEHCEDVNVESLSYINFQAYRVGYALILWNNIILVTFGRHGGFWSICGVSISCLDDEEYFKDAVY